jgi:hypothetical protein
VVAAVVLISLALIGGLWQLRRFAMDAWRASLEQAVQVAHAATDQNRRYQLALTVESQVMGRIDNLPSAAPWLWRIVGKARLVRSEPQSAEHAFRAANQLWPHEEAELGLGIALDGQQRRSEAMFFLGRVCRTNPTLARQIQDEDLRRAVQDLIRTRRRAERRASRSRGTEGRVR